MDEDLPVHQMYVRFLQHALERRESLTRKSSTDAVQKARARLLNVRVEDAEHDLAEKRGELIPLEIFRQEMAEMILQSRQQLLLLLSRIAAELENEPRHIIRAKLTRAVHQALTALSKGPDSSWNTASEDPVADPPAHVPTTVTAVDAASGSNGST